MGTLSVVRPGHSGNHPAPGRQAGEARVLLRALGPIALTDGDSALGLPRGRVTALLAWFAAHRTAGVSVDATLTALWPHLDRAAAGRELRRNLAVLRQRLASFRAHVVRRDGHLALVLPAGAAVDVDLFDDRLAAAEESWARGAALPALGLVRQALALWRADDPFVEIRDTPAGAEEALRLGERRLRVLDLRDGLRLRFDPDSRLVADLEAKVAANPVHELGWRQLMVALNDSGHRAGALRAFESCRRALRGLGLKPSDETRRVEAALLAGQAPDAALYVPSPRPADGRIVPARRDGPTAVGSSVSDPPAAPSPGRPALEALVDHTWAQPSRARLVVMVGGREAAGELADVARRRGGEVVLVTPDRPAGPVLRSVRGGVPSALIVDRAEEAPPDTLRAVGELSRGPGPFLIALVATPGQLGPLSDLILHADDVLEHAGAT